MHDTSTTTDGPTSNWFLPVSSRTREGDLVLLLTADNKRYLIKLVGGRNLHTHCGIFAHDDVIGLEWGTVVESKRARQALLLRPSVDDLIRHLKRGTQIIYPKDAAHLVHRMGLRAGSLVIEAGTGSGGLTTALAWSVAPTGQVYSYEVRPENAQLAKRNLERVGLLPYVSIFERSIRDGFLQENVDALFLDLREPWQHLETVHHALRSGGMFASLVPTTNQVTRLLEGLEAHQFADISVEELLLRRYKAVPERLRPEDEMVAHTGFMVFARAVSGPMDREQWLSKERKRYRARRRAEEEMAARAAAGSEDGRKYPRLPLPG